MAWVRLEDNFPEHPKVAVVGGDAAWLHVCAIAYCSRNLTDGFIPAGSLRQLSDRKQPILLATKLVTAGLWERVDNGFAVHDYLEYNPARKEVEAERAERSAKKAEAGRLGGIASGVAKRKHKRSNPEANGQANGQANTNEIKAPTRPDPTRPEEPDDDDNSRGLPPAAVVVIDRYVEFSKATSHGQAGNGRYAAGIRRNVVAEHGGEITQAVLAGQRPEQVLEQLFGITSNDLLRHTTWVPT